MEGENYFVFYVLWDERADDVAEDDVDMFPTLEEALAFLNKPRDAKHIAAAIVVKGEQIHVACSIDKEWKVRP